MNTEINISLDQQRNLILESLRHEGAYYLETVPNLLLILQDIHFVWMTGTDEGYGLEEGDCVLRARVKSPADAASLKKFFGVGETSQESLSGHTEYYWEATVKTPGHLIIRENV